LGLIVALNKRYNHAYETHASRKESVT